METLLISDYLNGMSYPDMTRKYRITPNRIAIIMRKNFVPMRYHRYCIYHPSEPKGFLIRPTERQAKKAMSLAMNAIMNDYKTTQTH